MKSDDLEFHEYANLFPMMEGVQLEEFKKNIAEKGVLDPVILFENKILDGRNRYRAAQETDRECRFEVYSGDDPLGFVISHNMHRRHLSESQRAMVAARAAKLQNGHNQYVAKVGPSIDGPTSATKRSTMSSKEAGELLNVGPRTVERAKRIQREATPEVIAAVDAGKMSINAGLKTIPKKEAKVEKKEEVDKTVIEAQDRFQKAEQLTQKQTDVRKTKEYRLLSRAYEVLNSDFNKLQLEHRRVIDESRRVKTENEELKRQIEELKGAKRNAS